MKIRKILAVPILAAAVLTGSAVPALASTGTVFQVIVNGNADVTRQPLAVKQVITCGGLAYTVQSVQGGYGTYEITTTPRLTASAVCSA